MGFGVLLSRTEELGVQKEKRTPHFFGLRRGWIVAILAIICTRQTSLSRYEMSGGEVIRLEIGEEATITPTIKFSALGR